MGVPTSEVGYTSAMPRREDHEVRKGHVGHWIKKDLNKKEVYNLTENVIQKLIMAMFSNPFCITVPCQLLLNRSVISYSPSDKAYSGQSNIVNIFKPVNFHIFSEIQRS